MKILHIAVENFAGIPMRLVREERRRGHDSRLVTLLTPRQNFEEDIALRLPFLNMKLMPSLRKLLRGKIYQDKTNTRRTGGDAALYWQPANLMEEMLLKMRDLWWKPAIYSCLAQTGHPDDYDIIIADGGHDFTRFPDILSATKTPVIAIYYGSDLRMRGIIRQVQDKAQATFTFEHDHTLIFPTAEFLFYAYQPPQYSPQFVYTAPRENETIRIGHAPTHRISKGTDAILGALRELQQHYPIEIVLIENVTHNEALRLKSTCHLFIDNVGELGYGLNSVESLQMGIPTCVELLPDFEEFLRRKCNGILPFYNIRRASLREDVAAVLHDRLHWRQRSDESALWANTYHSVSAVADTYLKKIEELIK